MQFPSLSHLSPDELRTRLFDVVRRHRSATAEMLHVLAEADRRRLWAEDGYPSMYAWCMAEFGFSEDMAAKRICAAREVRRHPEILTMVADGRLHLSGIVVLAPKLREATASAAELLAASAHRSRRAIEHLLAERFPQPDVASAVVALPAPGRVTDMPLGTAAPPHSHDAFPASPGLDLTPAPAADEPPQSAPAPARMVPAPECSRVKPLAPQRYAVQFTMDDSMHADLVRAQELLGPQSDDDRVRAVFRRALSELVKTLEKRTCAATEKPHSRRKPARGARIPARVKREVRARDGNRCTWRTEDGRRCESRSQLQYDHIVPSGKGGTSEACNVRLLCPAHNQLAAEKAYGEGLIHGIRERQRRSAQRAQEAGAIAPG